jgi:serine/threonine-protein kinase
MVPDSAVGDTPQRPYQAARLELTQRLWAGENCRAEDYLASVPPSDCDDEDALELIYTEFVVRQELGQHPSPVDWLTRFSHWHDRLECLLQIGDLLDDVDDLMVDGSASTPVDNQELGGEAAAAATHESRGSTARARRCDDPSWIDEYEVLDEVGKGAMGVVHRARQVALNRIVALKEILAGHHTSPDRRARFRREAENMARLRHPNIVHVYAVGEREGRPFISMEFVDGPNLAKKFASEPCPQRQAAQWLEVLARTVHYAHQKGVIHRDLKPSNVVLTSDGVPKITDFGLAKVVASEPLPADAPAAGSSDAQVTRVLPSHSANASDTLLALPPDAESPPEGPDTSTGLTVGTPSYMSPEQAAGHSKNVGPLTDVYSLGAILFELLTGQPPFRSKAFMETLRQVREQQPPRPRALNPTIDPDLEAVCLKCLKKEPGERYASAEALADDLGRWLRGKATRARPLLPWPARLHRSIRRHPRVASGILAIALGAAVTLVVAYHRGPESELSRIERTLKVGQPVVLIGEHGPPVWSDATMKPDDLTTCTSAGAFFAVATRKRAFIELLPSLNIARYSFRAEVRHDEFDGGVAEVGIYFAHTARANEVGKAHFCFALAFNDRLDGPKTYGDPLLSDNPVQLSDLRLADPRGDTPSYRQRHGMRWFTPVARDATIDPWRPLKVTVSPQRVQAFWDGQALVASNKSHHWDMADLPPDFTPQGGLGVYVLNASASFRRAVVEPLDEKN